MWTIAVRGVQSRRTCRNFVATGRAHRKRTRKDSHPMSSWRVVRIDGDSLTLREVLAVARGAAQVALSPRPGVRERIEASMRLNRELIAEGIPIYGVTTGVGDSVHR